MEIKVNYTAEKGLVQELVGDGQGVFNVEGVQIGQNVLETSESSQTTASNVFTPQPITDIIFVRAGIGAHSDGSVENFTVQTGSYVGQIITIILKQKGNSAGINLYGQTGPGQQSQITTPVTDEIYTAGGNNLGNNSNRRIMWLGDRWIPLGYQGPSNLI